MEMKLNQLKDYFKANPGTPFILAFLILLLSAATLLAINRPYDADSVANYGFFSLVLGIAIQVIVTIRESRKHSHPSNSRPPDPA